MKRKLKWQQLDEEGPIGTPTPLICNYIAMKCRNSGNSLWMRYKLLEEQRTLTFLH